MCRQHEVNVVVERPDGSRHTVLKTRKRYMREALIRMLFGDAREILILDPGETVQTVAVKEIKEN